VNFEVCPLDRLSFFWRCTTLKVWEHQRACHLPWLPTLSMIPSTRAPCSVYVWKALLKKWGSTSWISLPNSVSGHRRLPNCLDWQSLSTSSSQMPLGRTQTISHQQHSSNSQGQGNRIQISQPTFGLLPIFDVWSSLGICDTWGFDATPTRNWEWIRERGP